MIDINETCKDLETKMSKEDLEWVKTMPEADLCSLHHSLGRFIRNTYRLWEIEWEPEIQDNVDVSPYHPDAISMEIIKIFHKKLNEK